MMMAVPESDKSCVLCINGGSSSIKFALYKIENTLQELFHGELENIGSKDAKLNFTDTLDNQKKTINIELSDDEDAVGFLIQWLEKQNDFASIKAIGHRIVQGMQHTAPELINAALIEYLKKISVYDSEHLPEEIQLIETFAERHPELLQVACFDTSFHADMPQVAKLLSIPRRYYAMGIHRYGFHGLSYSYLMQELERVAGNEKANGKIILAHLGNGASLAAVKNGKSIDTSMGFTATAGIPMGTRTGDLDPGVASFLMRAEKFSAEQFDHLINHESGLLGISETSSDMRELLKNKNTDIRAEEAIELFCYQTKKRIGSFAAALEGLDSLIFSAGIGEHSPEIRKRICSGLQFLGIELDDKRNETDQIIISTDDSSVTIYVIPTNEELMIARTVCEVLNYSIKQ